MSIVAMYFLCSVSSCGDETREPLERIGEPLTVTPSTDGGSTSDVSSPLPTAEGGASRADEGDASSSFVPSDDDARPRAPQPAKALALAAEADQQGGSPSQKDLADALGVSVRTIRNDLHGLRQTGHKIQTRK